MLICEKCGTTAEDYEFWHGKPLTLTAYHGDMICPFCIDEERVMAQEDAKHGIITIWFDDPSPAPESEAHDG